MVSSATFVSMAEIWMLSSNNVTNTLNNKCHSRAPKKVTSRKWIKRQIKEEKKWHLFLYKTRIKEMLQAQNLVHVSPFHHTLHYSSNLSFVNILTIFWPNAFWDKMWRVQCFSWPNSQLNCQCSMFSISLIFHPTPSSLTHFTGPVKLCYRETHTS